MALIQLIDPTGAVVDLGSELVTMDAPDLVIAIEGAAQHAVWLDGTRRALPSSQRAFLSIDLRRSTGFHRLECDGRAYWFGSDDHKLRLDGLAELLRELRSLGTAWSGQAMFSDGALLRDPHVVFGWLDANADDALRSIASIGTEPIKGQETTRRLTRRGSGRVDVRRSLALLRVRGSEYLEKDPNGILEVGGDRYTPLRVVERRTRSTLDTVWNRRCAALCEYLDSLCTEVIRAELDATTNERCLQWQTLARSVGRRLPVQAPVGPLLAATITAAAEGPELWEARYESTFGVARSLDAAFGWQANHRPIDRYSYVQYADAIYQLYVTHVLARVLDMQPTTPVFGTSQPVFRSDEFDLFYDTPPAGEVLRSWRAGSSSPDTSRPDVLLVHRVTREVIVIDAKYRADHDRVTEDSRKEVSAYMALYGVSAVGIAFPSATTDAIPITVEGAGNKIVEIPIRPGIEFGAETRDAVLGLLSTHPY